VPRKAKDFQKEKLGIRDLYISGQPKRVSIDCSKNKMERTPAPWEVHGEAGRMNWWWRGSQKEKGYQERGHLRGSQYNAPLNSRGRPHNLVELVRKTNEKAGKGVEKKPMGKPEEKRGEESPRNFLHPEAPWGGLKGLQRQIVAKGKTGRTHGEKAFL